MKEFVEAGALRDAPDRAGPCDVLAPSGHGCLVLGGAVVVTAEDRRDVAGRRVLTAAGDRALVEGGGVSVAAEDRRARTLGEVPQPAIVASLPVAWLDWPPAIDDGHPVCVVAGAAEDGLRACSGAGTGRNSAGTRAVVAPSGDAGARVRCLVALTAGHRCVRTADGVAIPGNEPAIAGEGLPVPDDEVVGAGLGARIVVCSRRSGSPTR